MTDQKKPDLNDLIRRSRPTNKVHWTPETDPDPAIRQRDHDSLNRALRRAGGKDAPEPDAAPTYSWQSRKDGR